jgi:hypothetical protein
MSNRRYYKMSIIVATTSNMNTAKAIAKYAIRKGKVSWPKFDVKPTIEVQNSGEIDVVIIGFPHEISRPLEVELQTVFGDKVDVFHRSPRKK